jgi:hypothetical protein
MCQSVLLGQPQALLQPLHTQHQASRVSRHPERPDMLAALSGACWSCQCSCRECATDHIEAIVTCLVQMQASEQTALVMGSHGQIASLGPIAFNAVVTQAMCEKHAGRRQDPSVMSGRQAQSLSSIPAGGSSLSIKR